jgi:hypothetical protein
VTERERNILLGISVLCLAAPFILMLLAHLEWRRDQQRRRPRRRGGSIFEERR